MEQCSFCDKFRTDVDNLIENDNGDAYICNSCVNRCVKALDQKPHESMEKMYPSIIKEYLDLYVIGQDDAKMSLSVAAYNHMKRIQSKSF